jgi:hypothetical protein
MTPRLRQAPRHSSSPFGAIRCERSDLDCRDACGVSPGALSSLGVSRTSPAEARTTHEACRRRRGGSCHPRAGGDERGDLDRSAGRWTREEGLQRRALAEARAREHPTASAGRRTFSPREPGSRLSAPTNACVSRTVRSLPQGTARRPRPSSRSGRTPIHGAHAWHRTLSEARSSPSTWKALARGRLPATRAVVR